MRVRAVVKQRKKKEGRKKDKPEDFVPPHESLFVQCFFVKKVAECVHGCRKQHEQNGQRVHILERSFLSPTIK